MSGRNDRGGALFPGHKAASVPRYADTPIRLYADKPEELGHRASALARLFTPAAAAIDRTTDASLGRSLLISFSINHTRSVTQARFYSRYRATTKFAPRDNVASSLALFSRSSDQALFAPPPLSNRPHRSRRPASCWPVERISRCLVERMRAKRSVSRVRDRVDGRKRAVQDLCLQGRSDQRVTTALLHAVLEAYTGRGRPVLPGVRGYVPRVQRDVASNEYVCYLYLRVYFRCAGCHVNGQMVTADRSVTTTEDPCVTCRCNGGRLTCAKQACPVLHCPSSRIVHDPGECCPRCRGSTRGSIF